GDLKDIKQNMDYNKNFVQIPLQNLVEKIKYKAAIEGIEVDYISEKYTSGVSA
ncbi:MAG: IS200/IS605 family accessory protein TnpB-related protein, partial [Clostridia bacterium]|nr:IS200/IS605 family accessory protein TnpB-related protein [Clostridia bacterium]